MTNSRIALAVLAAASLSILSQPAEARPRHATKSEPARVLSTIDVAAVPAYPTAEMPGQPARRAGRSAPNRLRAARDSGKPVWTHQEGSYEQPTFLPHPAGCPRRAFCACGAAVKIFGEAKRNLWLVSAWRQFARDVAAPGNVAIERWRSHLFVLVSHIAGDDWLVDDFNSGGHQSRRHVRSIQNAIIVNPRSSQHADHTGRRL